MKQQVFNSTYAIHNILLALILLLSLVFFAACGEETQNESSVKPESSVATYEDPMVAYEAFLKGKITAKGTKPFYVTEMDNKNLQPGINTFALFDVNGDEIAELITDSYTIDVFALKNGELVHLYQTPAGSDVEVNVLSNGALFSKHSSTGVTYEYTTISETGEVTTVSFVSPPEGLDNYIFDGKKVAKDEWDSLTAEYFVAAEKTADLQWIEN